MPTGTGIATTAKLPDATRAAPCAQRPAPIHNASNLQIVTMRSEGGRNDGYPVLSFGESQQGMWRAGFEPNVGFEAREAAGCVKGSAKAVPAIQQEQRVRCQARNLDRALAAKRRRRMARGKELSRFQCLAPELPVVQRDPIWKHLTKMYLATLQHCENFKTAPLRDSYLHVGIALRVTVQELRKHAFDV